MPLKRLLESWTWRLCRLQRRAMHAKTVIPFCPAARSGWTDHGRCPRHPRHDCDACLFVAQRPRSQAASREARWGPAWRRSSPAAVKCLHTRTANLGVEGHGWHGWHRADTQPTVESIPYPDACHGQIGTQTGLLGSSHAISTRGGSLSAAKRDCLGKHKLFAHDVTVERGSLRPRL